MLTPTATYQKNFHGFCPFRMFVSKSLQPSQYGIL
jgi:hypothetical protein